MQLRGLIIVFELCAYGAFTSQTTRTYTVLFQRYRTRVHTPWQWLHESPALNKRAISTTDEKAYIMNRPQVHCTVMECEQMESLTM